MSGFEREEYDSAVDRLREELDRGSLGSAWAEGGGMTADAAVAFALSPEAVQIAPADKSDIPDTS